LKSGPRLPTSAVPRPQEPQDRFCGGPNCFQPRFADHLNSVVSEVIACGFVFKDDSVISPMIFSIFLTYMRNSGFSMF
jgi:hypothetical protein